MKNPVTKIGILLLLIIALPPIFFSAYEMGNMAQNEMMIDSIYTSQLESVLFSINQYSDDVVSGWANRIEQSLQKGGTTEREKAIREFMGNNISMEAIFLADSLKISRMFFSSSREAADSLTATRLEQVLSRNRPEIFRLIQYMEVGYRRIQPIDLEIPNRSLFLFAYNASQKGKGICGIVVNSERFTAENLGPKIQSVAQDKFYISVFDVSTGGEIYSNVLYEDEEKDIRHMKELWLMPDYHLGIQLRGETIEDLVQQRTNFNLWLILLMDAILILAAVFVYRSIRQQVRLTQIKSEFISNVSHEIRTPLAVINMYSETLEMDRIKDEEKKKEYYRIINTETNRLSAIVNKILNFSRIESGKRSYKFEETDLNELITKTLDTYQHHFKNKGFTCNFMPAENLPVIIADHEALTDALINLIDNAIKYSNDKKQIDIETGKGQNTVFVSIKDYGVGIADKDQKLVFDKFYRVTRGNLAHQAKGSGIGLSIVKHIMEAHGGSVSLKSKSGEGSRFTLHFPVKSS